MVLALWLGLLAMGQAQAQCSTNSAVPASFGTVTSFTVRNTQQRTSTTNAGLSCNGSTLAALSTNNIYGTLSSLNNGHLVSSATGDKIPYTVFADPGYATQLNFGTQYNWAQGQLLNILSLLGGNSAPLPLYLQTATGSTVAAGTYIDTITIHWSSSARWGCSASVFPAPARPRRRFR
jgi:spore coat protein U-like protein